MGFFKNLKADVDGNLKVIVINAETRPVSFSIEAPGIGYHHSGTISSSGWQTIDIPKNAEVLSINDQNKGIYLTTSSDGVTVIGQSFKKESYGDSFTVLPASRMNIDHYVHYSLSTAEERSYDYNSVVLVIGIKDSTTMELTVTQPVQVKIESIIKTLIPGRQYSFMIDRLQTVYIATKKDLSGTKITTNNPVAVFSGHEHGYSGTNARPNYLIEQIPPTALWDSEHYFTNFGYGVLRVVAADDATNVDIYCNGIKESHTIDESQIVTKSFDPSFAEFCAVYSNKKVFVAQFDIPINFNTHMMTIIPGIIHYSNKIDSSTISPLDPSETYDHLIYFIVLAEYYQPNLIYLTNGGQTQTLDAGNWRPIVVDNVIKAYSLKLSIKIGPYTISHANPAAKMMAISASYTYFDGYGHSAKLTPLGMLCSLAR